MLSRFLLRRHDPEAKKLFVIKSTAAQQCILGCVILLVFVFFSSLHYFSHSFIEFRKKLGTFEFANPFDSGHGSKDGNESATGIIRPKIEAKRVFQEKIDIGEILPNCGLQQQCNDESFAIHVFTGSGKEDGPRLCVLGKYVLGAGLNNGGRGINVALIDPRSLRLVSVKNFDTYAGDSSQLETWMQSEILIGDIVIFFTFDEASKELSSFAKKLIFELGSYRVQELHFRSQWFMVSQRGIVGFTPYEVLHAASHSRWADPINIHLCVPRKLQGQAISPDPIISENNLRETFCQQFNDSAYEEFCEASARREPLTSALLTNRSLIGNFAFSTPVLLLSGSEPLATFEGVAGQPGITPSLVYVLYEVHHAQTPALATLFGFHPVTLPQPYSRSEKIECGLKLIKSKYPDKKYVLVLEDDLLLSPDFLAFMAQMIPVLEKDRTLLGVSAWNPNGFQSVTSDVNVAYRMEEFPGVGFLLPMAVYTTHMEGKFNVCCITDARDGWSDVLRASKGGNIIVPDVSRVLIPAPSINPDEPMRSVNIDVSGYINRPQDLEDSRYFQLIANLVKESNPLHMSLEDLAHCRIGDQLLTSKILQEYVNKKFVVYFKEDPKMPGQKLKQLIYCFGIPINATKPRGLYKHLLRLTVNHNSVLLIEAASPFFKSLPSSVQPL